MLQSYLFLKHRFFSIHSSISGVESSATVRQLAVDVYGRNGRFYHLSQIPMEHLAFCASRVEDPEITCWST